MSDPNLPDDPYAARPQGGDPYAQGSTGSSPAYGTPAGGYGQMPPAPPAGSYGMPMGTPPKNYMVWAILSTFLCCMPLGIASIVFAAQVNSKWSTGDHAGAQASADKAKKFAIASAIASVVVYAIYGILMAMGVFDSTVTPTPAVTH